MNEDTPVLATGRHSPFVDVEMKNRYPNVLIGLYPCHAFHSGPGRDHH
jgi:hypothetical protein